MTNIIHRSSTHSIRESFTLALLAITIFSSCKATEPIPEAYLLTANQHARCMELLREGLHGKEFWASIYSAEALVREEYSFEVTPLFRSRIEQESDDRRRAAYATVLVRAGYREALVMLQDLLLSNDPETKILAAQGMFRSADVADVSLLEEAMTQTQNNRLSLYAAAALALARDAKTLNIIRRGLESSDAAARYVAADIIAVLGAAEDDMDALLQNREQTSSEFERFYVLRALAIFGHDPSRQELTAMLEHSDPTIRARAAFVMGEAWIVEQSDRLYALLDDPAMEVRVRAAQALLILSSPVSPERYLRLR